MNEVIVGKIISVGDGDTFRLITENGEKKTIRLSYVDAPELKQKGGYESRERLKLFLPVGETVEVIKIGRDYYKRITGLVYVNDVLINLELVKQGSAVIYRNYLTKKNPLYPEFKQAEVDAKLEQLGFWKFVSQQQDIMPWTYRKIIKEEKQLKLLKQNT